MRADFSLEITTQSIQDAFLNIERKIIVNLKGKQYKIQRN
jgi:hypothetical protein